MNTKRILVSLSGSFLIFAASAVLFPVIAQTCGQYGTSACPPQDLSIDKKVIHPINGNFVENLQDKDGEFFSPGSEVTYSLKVTNSGNTDFATVQVTDTLPEWMEVPKAEDVLDSGKVTDIKINARQISFIIKDGITAGKDVEIKIKAKVVSDLKLANGDTKRCGITNNARVTANDRSDDDSSTLCAITKIGETKKLPSAGPEDYLPLLPFIVVGFTGAKLLIGRKS